MLKEAALRTGCLRAVTAVAGRADLDPQVLAERLLLCVYAYGTNTSLRAVAAGDHRRSEDDLRYVRRRFLSAEAARAMAVELANATFTARQQAIWGAGSTAVASDSTPRGRVRPEHLHPVALALRRSRGADLLARGAPLDGDPLAVA